MIETLAALLFAHALADFVLQTNWMAANKSRATAMAAHLAVVTLTAFAATGSLSPAILALAVLHLAIDLAKTFSGKSGIWPFLADQAAHGLSLIAVAAFFPTLWTQGIWAPFPWLASVMVLAAGLILATRAGGFAVGIVMEPWAAAAPAGLPGGGRTIGNLERGLIFLLILTGQAQSIGFLIAAKSVLRFGAISNEKEVSEYVIVGTLASFTWSLAVSFVTVVMLNHLPTLGIPDLLP